MTRGSLIGSRIGYQVGCGSVDSIPEPDTGTNAGPNAGPVNPQLQTTMDETDEPHKYEPSQESLSFHVDATANNGLCALANVAEALMRRPSLESPSFHVVEDEAAYRPSNA